MSIGAEGYNVAAPANARNSAASRPYSTVNRYRDNHEEQYLAKHFRCCTYPFHSMNRGALIEKSC